MISGKNGGKSMNGKKENVMLMGKQYLENISH